MPHLAIIADDLTGALDSAAPFAMRGLRTLVATGPGGLDLALGLDPDIVAVSLNSREIDAEEAAVRVARAAGQLQTVPVWFKKVDSRLKGHVAAETKALVRRGRFGLPIILCPAIPEFGRLVRGGMIEGFGIGQPLAVAATAGLESEPGLAVPDAISDGDLDRIVTGAAPGTVFVGARGLAAALARHIAPQTAGTDGDPRPQLPAPVNFLIGSRDPITRAQLDLLAQVRPDLSMADAPDGVVPALGDGMRILRVRPGSAARRGADVTKDLVAGFLDNGLHRCGTLAVTGGETASALFAQLRIEVLDLCGEVLPGLPLSRDATTAHGPLFCTKSGGFGADGALLAVLDAAGG